MLKVLTTWKYPGYRAPEECDAHYQTVHTPLVRQMFEDIPGILGYVQNRVTKSMCYDYNGTQERAVNPLFDRSVELYVSSGAVLRQMASHDTMRRAIADHPNFMATDQERSMDLYLIEETIALARPEWIESIRATQ